MNTSLEHLPEQKQLREITGIIVKAVDPEKVILLGSHGNPAIPARTTKCKT
ncbi:MAG: hypothetical protein J0H74_35990 [Chitinophagaceae bacterium]|nr:hypothetical protein [Chitinophagaceae bacterium]